MVFVVIYRRHLLSSEGLSDVIGNFLMLCLSGNPFPTDKKWLSNDSFIFRAPQIMFWITPDSTVNARTDNQSTVHHADERRVQSRNAEHPLFIYLVRTDPRKSDKGPQLQALHQ